jgi:NitT/TauT family transport system substrate-binding protein
MPEHDQSSGLLRPAFRQFLPAALMLMASVLPAAAQQKSKITLAYSASAAFTNAFVAADQGIFSKHGLDVEMKLIPNSSTLPAALASNSLQIGGTTAPVTLQAVEAGIDLVVLGGGGITAKDQDEAAVLAHEGTNIREPKDFIGKRVGTPGLNAYLHVLFRQWLADRGVDWRKVTFVEVPFAQLADVLRAGQVDAILIGEPFKSRALDTKAGYLVAPYVNEFPAGITSIWYVATRKWADTEKDAAKAFQAALTEATSLAMSNSGVERKAIATYVKLPPEALAKLPIPSLQANVPPEKVSFWIKMGLDQGLLRKKLDPNRVPWP